MFIYEEPTDDNGRDPNPDSPPPEKPDSTSEGERLRDEAHGHLRDRRQHLIRAGEKVLIRKIVSDGSATIDDVRAEVPCPPGIDPRFFGAIPGPLVKFGAIRPLGYTKTRRSVAHARMLIEWGLGDLSKALTYLTDPEPTGEEVTV